jgi:Tol biopolymer transport system component
MAALFSSVPTEASDSTPLGQFEDHTDVGSPAIAGSVQYDPIRQEYAVAGAGVNMWNKRDEFQFVWKRLKGDFILQARVAFAGKGAEAHRKIGWMARPSLDPDSMCVDCAEHGNGLTSLQFRLSRGTNTQQQPLSVTNADVLQLERRGDTYIFSAARFGEPFVTSEIADLAMGEALYVGLFVCSHNAKVREQAVFRDVRIIQPARPGFVPYRDYIGSYLELLDLASGDRQLVYESAKPFEAPNWTPDGRFLIYNSSGSADDYRGRLYRFDLESKRPERIDTGFATRNNNDHVLSFDGTRLGISHQDPSHHGQSAVYTLPVEGGSPKLITPLTPSYLHGWSPDARFLVYTGGRHGEYNIYKIPAEGGDEVQLTRASGLNDGPEFSPDGKYIYFNSTRTGLMQLWRMKPDGSDQEQLTGDAFNNWFPHLSPDGQWIAFLSYSKDIKATDHPYYKQVYLRLLPVSGGRPKVVAYVYGGQGTMNVPSWSPDGKRLAFVSNSDLE